MESLREGWEAVVPIYNLYVLTLIVGQPWWLVILSLIPIVGILAMAFKLAERFGQGIPFAIGMIFLPFVFYHLLGFGDARYRPPAAVE